MSVSTESQTNELKKKKRKYVEFKRNINQFSMKLENQQTTFV